MFSARALPCSSSCHGYVAHPSVAVHRDIRLIPAKPRCPPRPRRPSSAQKDGSTPPPPPPQHLSSRCVPNPTLPLLHMVHVVTRKPAAGTAPPAGTWSWPGPPAFPLCRAGPGGSAARCTRPRAAGPQVRCQVLPFPHRVRTDPQTYGKAAAGWLCQHLQPVSRTYTRAHANALFSEPRERPRRDPCPVSPNAACFLKPQGHWLPQPQGNRTNVELSLATQA